MTFTNKTILITGASSGIGKAISKKLAEVDCTLILLARRTNLINEYLSNMNNKKANIIVEYCDVSDKSSVTKSMSLIKSKLNSEIDIAILAAGADYRAAITDFKADNIEEIFSVNVMGTVYLVYELLPQMMNRKDGMIVGISSLADSRGYEKSEFYCASKAAVTKILEGLRVELIPHNIKIITVKPGFVKTPMTDKNKFKMPFLMSPEKAADIILNGIKKEKSVIAFPKPIAFASWVGGILPSGIYEFFARRIKVE